tara:strand:+ start:89 stop:259 length:171 start_codon:yes stop_codon:yes gene_type:complete
MLFYQLCYIQVKTINVKYVFYKAIISDISLSQYQITKQPFFTLMDKKDKKVFAHGL